MRNKIIFTKKKVQKTFSWIENWIRALREATDKQPVAPVVQSVVWKLKKIQKFEQIIQKSVR